MLYQACGTSGNHIHCPRFALPNLIHVLNSRVDDSSHTSEAKQPGCGRGFWVCRRQSLPFFLLSID
jgi:hypothetical protein